jgi:hypothetical protein
LTVVLAREAFARTSDDAIVIVSQPPTILAIAVVNLESRDGLSPPSAHKRTDMRKSAACTNYEESGKV